MSDEIGNNDEITLDVLQSAHDNLWNEYKDEDPDNHYEDSDHFCAGVRRAGLAALKPLIEHAGGLQEFHEFYKMKDTQRMVGHLSDMPWGNPKERVKFYDRHEDAILEYYKDLHDESGLRFDSLEPDALHDPKLEEAQEVISEHLVDTDNLVAIATLMSNEFYAGTTSNIKDLKWQISGNFIQHAVLAFNKSVDRVLAQERNQERG